VVSSSNSRSMGSGRLFRRHWTFVIAASGLSGDGRSAENIRPLPPFDGPFCVQKSLLREGDRAKKEVCSQS
jgi:hypothetical protein